MNLATLPGLLAVLHALAGIGFIVGLFGRWMVLAAAERATTPSSMRLLARAAAPFETLVIAGSLVVFILGILTAWAEGLPLLGPFVGAGTNWLFVSLVLFLSVLPLVPLVFLPRGRVFEAALEEAEAAGVVTDRLRAAWSDPRRPRRTHLRADGGDDRARADALQAVLRWTTDRRPQPAPGAGRASRSGANAGRPSRMSTRCSRPRRGSSRRVLARCRRSGGG